MIELETLKILRFTGEKMKINAETFKQYLKACGLGATINSIKTVFEKDRVFTTMRNAPNTVFVNVSMKTGVFENYNELGSIIFRNIAKLQKYLNSYKKTDVEIKKTEEFVINISNDKQEHDVILGGESVVEDNIHDGSMLTLENCSVVEVPYADLVSATEQMKDVDSERIIFDKTEDLLCLIIDNGDSSDKSKVKIRCDDKTLNKTILGSVFLDVVQVFDKNFPVNVEVGTDVPVVFKQNTDILNIVVTVAPRVEND